MENAVEALKMGGAAMLFILAFSITMIMFGQCRTTADAVITNLQINSFMQGVNGLEQNITRKVGLETVIPTIYRYGNQDSNLRVVIKEGNHEVQVFDVGIEETVAKGIDEENNLKKAYSTYIAQTYNTRGTPVFMFDAPWVNNTELELERINCYITGDPFHLIKVDPIDQSVYANNYLLKSNNQVYKETYTEYRTSGKILIDEFGEEIIQQQPSGTFKIITYQRD